MGEDVVVPHPASPSDWVVLAPVKRLDRAKTRLSTRPAGERRDLARAFAIDTVRAALGCEAVARVVVVSDDDELREAVAALGAEWLPDREGADLNGLLAAVAADLRADDHDVALAALVADLPALRSDELRRALQAADDAPRSFVADAAGTGTTMLAARGGTELDPRFGVRSRAAHAASGAVALEPGPVPGLRRDVDTEVDLWDAGRLGLGPTTAALVLGG